MALTVFAANSGTNDVELWGTDGTTGRTFRIADIRPGADGSFAGNNRIGGSGGQLPFAVVGNFAYFMADDGINGPELWRTDGNSATKVSEFFTTNGDADPSNTTGYAPQNIVAANGFIFFVGSGPAASNPGTSAPVHGIWKYDPATGNITLVSTDVGISGMMAVGNRVYWTFDHATQGFRSSDGTDGADAGSEPDVIVHAGGTGLMYDAGGTLYHINQIGTSARKVVNGVVTELTGEPGGMQGIVHTSSHVYIFTLNGLFVTTTAGSAVTPIAATGLTFDFNFAGFGGHTPGFAAAGNKLIFANNKPTGVGATGSEVWVSDGTAGGTVLLKDIVPGIGNSVPHNFITVGNQAFFQATNGNGSVDLWKTDGTSAGTVLVETIFRGSWSTGSNQVQPPPELGNMTVKDGVLLFSLDDGVNGTELWRSDGTAAGTMMLRNINTTPINSAYQLLSSQGMSASLGSSGFFVGWSPQQGYELWSTNGAAGGTALLKDLNFGAGNSAPQQMTVAGGKIFFNAFDPAVGQELWVSDGTVAGTGLVKDIKPGTGSSFPGGFVAVGNKIYFAADDGVNGHELWVSDGTSGGTVSLGNLNPGTTSGFPNSSSPGGFTQVGSNVFFTATTQANGRELWVTDGTPGAGTHIVEEIRAGALEPDIQQMIAFNGKLYFTANDGVNGHELWVSDGTNGAGTAMLKNINTTDAGGGMNSGSNPSDFVIANGKLFFRANGTAGFGAEVYVSDGTVGNATAVTGTMSGFNQFAVANNQVFFSAQSGSQQELFVTSGSTATMLDIGGAASANVNQVVAAGNRVFFAAQDSTANGMELGTSNGTTTSLVKNINPILNTGSNPNNFVAVGNRVFFTANDGGNGVELWVSDGTDFGTHIVKNIGPLATNGVISPLKAIGGNFLLFMANDGTTGQELWITDGTDLGTFRATDVVQAGSSFFSGIGSQIVNNPFPSTFASLPGVTLGANSEILAGTPDEDLLTGLGGNDTITAFGGNDQVDGGIGNDILNGGGGNDFLNGGADDDTAVFSGNLSAYALADLGNRVLVSGPDGNDTLIQFEHLQFDNGTIHFNDGDALFDTIFYMRNNLDVFAGGADAKVHYENFGRHEGRDPNALFDTSAYLALNPDVAAAGANPLAHYAQFGGNEGRDPSFAFDNQFYLTHHPDVAAAGVNPLAHYLQSGISEGRLIGPAVGDGAIQGGGFDPVYYRLRYGDVAAAGVDPLTHYNEFGRHEGRDPSGYFSTTHYLSLNNDVAATGANPLQHYDQFGRHEGRDASPMFDTQLYLLHNPDVQAAGVNPLAHFLNNGNAEGRDAFLMVGRSSVGGFDADYYLMTNPDVAAAGVDPLQHFNTFGWREGRNPDAYFDTSGYLSHNPDVAAAGVNPLQHFHEFGWNEGRDPSVQFDTDLYLAANPDVAATLIDPLQHFLAFGALEGRLPVNDGVFD